MENIIECAIHHRPNGKIEVIILKNIYPEDAKFINDNKIKVSMEELFEGNIAVYFDYGKKVNDNPKEDPDELIELSLGRTCQETIKAAVIKLKTLIKNE